jgi:hypothetical protein
MMMCVMQMGMARVAAGKVPVPRVPQVVVAPVVARPLPVLEAEESHRNQACSAQGKSERVDVHGSTIGLGRRKLTRKAGRR